MCVTSSIAASIRSAASLATAMTCGDNGGASGQAALARAPWLECLGQKGWAAGCDSQRQPPRPWEQRRLGGERTAR